jgi:YVTN family beta-propeller protein
LDTVKMTEVGLITPPQPFWALALSPDGRRLYTSVPDAKRIAVIDTGTHRQIKCLAVGATPFIVLVAST